MKTNYFLFLLIILATNSSDLFSQNFYLHENGVTCMCPDAEIGETGVVNGITYTKRTREQITPQNASTTCTSGITNMSSLFQDSGSFNGDISTWDVSNVLDMNRMFMGCFSFNRPLENWDVSNVTNMSFMFGAAHSFNRPLNNWDVSNVSDMSYMFTSAESFNQPINDWDVGNVTNMSYMFSNAFSFNKPINNWNVSNVLDMSLMFLNAQSFNQALNDWNVGNVTNMSDMFREAPVFNQPLNNWDVGNVTNMEAMFSNTQTFNGDISGWDVGNVTNMGAMFSNAQTFNGDISGWDVGNVTNMGAMFSNAQTFNGDISGWNVGNVTNMGGMFYAATNFNQPLNNWDVSNVTSMAMMFAYANSFNQPLNSWDVSNVTDMSAMFALAENFNQPLNNWDVSNVTNMGEMFIGAHSFNGEINNWDVGNVTNMGVMFSNAQTFNGDISGWDVSNVTNMEGMFFVAQTFNIDISGWNVSNVTNMSSMFERAINFDQPLNNWDVSNVTNMGGMFNSAESFNQPLNSWDVSNVTHMGGMFDFAASFNQPLNDWDVSNVTEMHTLFYSAQSFNQDLSNWVFNPNGNFAWFLAYSNLSSENYEALLQSFVNQNLHDKELFAGGLSYCDASARNELINNMGWSIEGDTTTNTNITAPSNIVVSADPWVCHATNVDLGTPFAESCLDYSISNNAPEVFPLGQTVVIWTITDEAGITETSSQNVTVTQQSDNATICYVTTDDVEYSKNRIFINYNDGFNVDRYEVLRETSANIFSPIGFINPGETSFLDETSNNATQTYRYTVRTRDICQQTSPQSPVHTTMLLQSNVAANNSVNLNWNPYQGTTYGSFEIYRSINQGPFELLATLPGTNTAYNDVQANINENNYEYYVAIQVQPCSAKLNGAQIRSNREAVGNSVGIQSATLTNQLILYPNPSSSMIYIQAPAWLEIKEVKLFNLEGQLIDTYRQKIEFNVENLNSGIYFIQVFSEHGVITKKFTKN